VGRLAGSGEVEGLQARRRYQIAILSLGWLILLAVLIRGGFADGLQNAWDGVQRNLNRFGQNLSDREANARERVQKKSRREELAIFAPMLSSPVALKDPPAMLFGAYDGNFPRSFSGFTTFEEQLGFRFPIISFYQAWGDRPDQQHFPVRMVETIDRLGSVPMITWEPWVRDFDERRRTNLPPLAEREYATLAAVARGEYDFHLAPWATAAAEYGKPIFMRFAHEMNDPYRYPWGPQNGNRPDDFIAAWRHVHQIFQKMGATNVLWVWSPHISMPWFEYYYPGDEWVDWVGTGVLNYGDVAPWSRWWSFHQILDKAYPALEGLGKPIMISEFGTLTAGGDGAAWYARAFDDIRTKYPRIRSVIFFNQESDVTLSTAPLDWTVTQDREMTRVVSSAMQELVPAEPVASGAPE
jgi:hypothetical protein